MKIQLGDSLEILPSYETNSIDLLFTGVPDIQQQSVAAYTSFLRLFLIQAKRVVKPTGFIILAQTDRKRDRQILAKQDVMKAAFADWRLYAHKIMVKDDIDKGSIFILGYLNVLIFTQDGRVKQDKLKGKFMRDVWVYPYPRSRFDSSFCELLIDTFTQEGDTVLDPFSGSHVVPRVAEQMNRIGLGIENDPSLMVLL
jgi:DNA modification methylase